MAGTLPCIWRCWQNACHCLICHPIHPTNIRHTPRFIMVSLSSIHRKNMRTHTHTKSTWKKKHDNIQATQPNLPNKCNKPSCLSLISRNFLCSWLGPPSCGSLKAVKASILRRFNASLTALGVMTPGAPGFCTPNTACPARMPCGPRSKGTMKRFQCQGANLRKPRASERMASGFLVVNLQQDTLIWGHALWMSRIQMCLSEYIRIC